VYLELHFDGKFSLSIKFLFIRFYKYPHRIKKKIDKKKKNIPSSNRDSFEKSQILNLLSKILTTVKKTKKCFKRLYDDIVIDKLNVNLIVSTKDKAKTALLYGELCAIVYPLVSFISCEKSIKNLSVNVCSDFDSENIKIDLGLKIHIKFGMVLFGVFSFLKLFFKLSLPKKLKLRRCKND
jgi:hypothetical protein